jgi:hypothetical protein
MTLDRKVCKRCRHAVTLVTTVALRAALKQRPNEFPMSGVLLFLCPKHGELPWWEITHGEAVRTAAELEKEQPCLNWTT